ncbi:unnamed protein product [Musa acuminata subsp. burmannicoides]
MAKYGAHWNRHFHKHLECGQRLKIEQELRPYLVVVVAVLVLPNPSKVDHESFPLLRLIAVVVNLARLLRRRVRFFGVRLRLGLGLRLRRPLHRRATPAHTCVPAEATGWAEEKCSEGGKVTITDVEVRARRKQRDSGGGPRWDERSLSA